MSSFKLTYFDATGRGELTRLIFAKSGTKFEDVRIAAADWPKVKASMPTGKMPVLQHNGHVLVQSLVIARYAARKCGLVGRSEMDEFHCDMFVNCLAADIGGKLIDILFEKDPLAKAKKSAEAVEPTKAGLLKLCSFVKGEFVLGAEMSYADLAIFDADTYFAKCIPEAALPPKLKAIADKVKADPNIEAYLKAKN